MRFLLFMAAVTALLLHGVNGAGGGGFGGGFGDPPPADPCEIAETPEDCAACGNFQYSWCWTDDDQTVGDCIHHTAESYETMGGLSTCVHVPGDVHIILPSGVGASFPFKRVEGSLTVTNYQSNNLFPNLEHVGGDLRLENLGANFGPSLAALKTVGRSLFIKNCATTSFGNAFTQIETLTQLEITNCYALRSINLPMLKSIRALNDDWIGDQDCFSWSQCIYSTRGALILTDNSAMTSFESFANLESVDRLTITGNTFFNFSGFAKLQPPVHEMRLGYATALQDITFPTWPREPGSWNLTGRLWLWDLPLIMDLSPLSGFGYAPEIFLNRVVAPLSVFRPAQIWKLQLVNMPPGSLDFVNNTKWVAGHSVNDRPFAVSKHLLDVEPSANTGIADQTDSTDTDTNDMAVARAGGRFHTMAAPDRMPVLWITNSPLITNLTGIGSVTWLEVYIDWMDNLDDMSALTNQWQQGKLYLRRAPKLRTLKFPVMTELDLDLDSNPMQLMDFPVLTRAGVWTVRSTGLTRLSFGRPVITYGNVPSMTLPGLCCHAVQRFYNAISRSYGSVPCNATNDCHCTPNITTPHSILPAGYSDLHGSGLQPITCETGYELLGKAQYCTVEGVWSGAGQSCDPCPLGAATCNGTTALFCLDATTPEDGFCCDNGGSSCAAAGLLSCTEPLGRCACHTVQYRNETGDCTFCGTGVHSCNNATSVVDCAIGHVLVTIPANDTLTLRIDRCCIGAPQCGVLHREPCAAHGTACGACLPGYILDAGNCVLPVVSSTVESSTTESQSSTADSSSTALYSTSDTAGASTTTDTAGSSTDTAPLPASSSSASGSTADNATTAVIIVGGSSSTGPLISPFVIPPVTSDVIATTPVVPGGVRVSLSVPALNSTELNALIEALLTAAGLPRDRVVIVGITTDGEGGQLYLDILPGSGVEAALNALEAQFPGRIRRVNPVKESSGFPWLYIVLIVAFGTILVGGCIAGLCWRKRRRTAAKPVHVVRVSGKYTPSKPGTPDSHEHGSGASHGKSTATESGPSGATGSGLTGETVVVLNVRANNSV